MAIPIIAVLISFFPSLHFQPYLLDQALWLIFLLSITLYRGGLRIIPITLCAMCIWQGLNPGKPFDVTTSRPLWVLVTWFICALIPIRDAVVLMFTMVFVVSVRLLLGTSTIINSSIDSVFLAAMFPLLQNETCTRGLLTFCPSRFRTPIRVGVLILPACAIILTGSTVGIVCLGIALVWYIRWYALWYPFLMLPILWTNYLDTFLNDGGRTVFWGKAFLHLWHSSHRWFGWGVDSFTPIMTKVEIDNGAKELLYVHSHNTYLRILFEYGFVGLLLCGFFIGLRFKRVNFKLKIVILTLMVGAFFHNIETHPVFLLLIFSLL